MKKKKKENSGCNRILLLTYTNNLRAGLCTWRGERALWKWWQFFYLILQRLLRLVFVLGKRCLPIAAFGHANFKKTFCLVNNKEKAGWEQRRVARKAAQREGGWWKRRIRGLSEWGGSPFHCRRSIVVYYNVVYSITVLWYYSLMCINVVYSITVLWY